MVDSVRFASSPPSDGRREVLGMDIGPSEAETFWTEFLRKLARRGLRGVKLVLSDAHEGIKAVVAKVLHASWQRRRTCTSCAMCSPMPVANAEAASKQPLERLRDGVRTPMQWSPDRNGGFSRADPAALVLPMIMDPLYGYGAVNVEAQGRDPHSLLNWMRRFFG
jgi:glycosidase